MPSKTPILDRKTLEGMHTGSLLSHLQKLRACEETFSQSDRNKIKEEPSPQLIGHIEFKDTAEWKTAYSLTKEILSTREHLPTAAERKRRRGKDSFPRPNGSF